jgi:hypothetical protein
VIVAAVFQELMFLGLLVIGAIVIRAFYDGMFALRSIDKTLRRIADHLEKSVPEKE